MSLNKKKMSEFIANRLESEKPYYPKELFEGVEWEIYPQSFGSMYVGIKSQYNEQSPQYIGNYNTLDNLVFKFLNNSYTRFLEIEYHKHQKQPLKSGFDFLADLYEHKAKSNCSYYELKNRYTPDLLIVFLGTSDFIIVNNYYGVVAFGVRSYNYDTETSTYKVKEQGEHIGRAKLSQLCRHYENKRLKNKKVVVEFLGNE